MEAELVNQCIQRGWSNLQAPCCNCDDGICNGRNSIAKHSLLLNNACDLVVRGGRGSLVRTQLTPESLSRGFFMSGLDSTLVLETTMHAGLAELLTTRSASERLMSILSQEHKGGKNTEKFSSLSIQLFSRLVCPAFWQCTHS